MAAVVVTKPSHTAMIPWTDVQADIVSNADTFLQVRPQLTVNGMPMGGGMVGIKFSWDVSPQKLDAMLRSDIPELPALGMYSVSMLANDPINALSVTWTEES